MDKGIRRRSALLYLELNFVTRPLSGHRERTANRTQGGCIRDRSVQTEYLRSLHHSSGLTIRDIARQSSTVADQMFHDPKLAFTHQALSAWLRGSRNPRREHREMLAMIFGISGDEMNTACGFPSAAGSGLQSILRPVRVYVNRHGRAFQYSLTVKGDVNLRKATVYRHWTEIFDPRPAILMRHFRHINYDLYGWVPNRSLWPLVSHARSMIPLNTRPMTSLHPESAGKKIWFVLLPDGRTEFGFSVRQGPWLVLSKSRASGAHSTKYRFDRVDPLGFIAEEALFHVYPVPASQGQHKRAGG